MFTDHQPSSSDMAGYPGLVDVAFPGGWVVQAAAGLDGPARQGAEVDVAALHPAVVRLTSDRVSAMVGAAEWAWLYADLVDVHHGGDEPWTILAVPGIADFGVAVAAGDTARFRRQLESLLPASTRVHDRLPSSAPDLRTDEPPSPAFVPGGPADRGRDSPRPSSLTPMIDWSTLAGADTAIEIPPVRAPEPVTETRAPRMDGAEPRRERSSLAAARVAMSRGQSPNGGPPAAGTAPQPLAGLEARSVSAWFGTHLVLDRVSLDMGAGQVTALIGPSGCGKSTFLRILNRMHEMIPSAALAGEVLLDGADIYEPSRKVTDARRQIGMVFQKPNPFPAMSIYENVLASFQLTGHKLSTEAKDDVVESCLRKGGLWNEVHERLRQPGGSLSGGQQQRLCIARALAIRPRVLLMDEPCSALDPTSTRRIEQTIAELKSEVTIVIVTHNMQQAARVSDRCAFFLAEQNTPGIIVEHGPTEAMFHTPQDSRTSDYVNGRFG